MRRDLAEIEVADRIFAQHFVEPLPVVLTAPVQILVRPTKTADLVTTLAAGETFLVVDVGHEWAWGRGEAVGTVGYVAAATLDLP